MDDKRKVFHRTNKRDVGGATKRVEGKMERLKAREQKRFS